jgi:hypothetical protein
MVRSSPAVTVEVEVVPVAPAQPEGDASSAGMPELREARVESWTPSLRMARVESWEPRGARQKSVKQATKKSRRAERSDHLGWWSDHQPLFHGRSNCLRPRSDHQ